ncbi:MAG: TonB-dependent receptor [Bacteroidota bacterium]
MRHLLLIILVAFSVTGRAQTEVTGLVSDRTGEPILGASIFIVGTYDGGISEADGSFSFQTYAGRDEEVEISVSYLGYTTVTIKAPVDQLRDLRIELRETITSMNAVTVSASTFTAGDNSKVAVLKPLDIVTTAGSVGDVFAALQTLPGTQANPDDGRLFVRGGDARETNVYVDGLRVFTPYVRTIGGSPTRGRFSPMLFKGVSFATGGYSAAFGQALSGVLDLNTTDVANQTETNLNFMSLGVNVGHTQVWDNQSLSVNGSYINLAPYAGLVPTTRLEWLKPYRGFSGEAVYRRPTERGLFKMYLAADDNNLRLAQENLDREALDTVGIRNRNLYGNASYRGFLSDQTSLFAGLSVGLNRDDLSIESAPDLQQRLNGFHTRFSLKTVWSDRFMADYGIEYLREYDQQRISHGEFTGSQDLGRGQTAAFAEANYFFSTDLALRVGLRTEHSGLLDQVSLSPRLTLAQKVSNKGQVSAAFGSFTQALGADFLYVNPNLDQERAEHYLVNYNFKTDKHILRLEAYYKSYKQLGRFDGAIDQTIDSPDNNGEGFAYGFDFFWRANQVVKNVDFWVSYSWLEHERQYRDFPVAATPSFATRHNLSLVSKIWMPGLKSQLGLTFNLISGRPYENPNTVGFLNERSPAFRGLNLSWAYLIDPQKILFFSASNVTGFRNEFGYEYGNQLNADGLFPSRAIRPNDDQFFFAGFFVTISPDKTKNQLNNL